jgi:cell division protein FtsB
MTAARTRRGFTGRALVLGGVVVLLVVALAAPLHRYVAARGALSQAEQEQQDSRLALTDLQRQQAQWNDPSYIEQQARRRLQYAMPGDTVYLVVTPDTKTGLTPAGVPDRGATELPGQTWNQRMWESLRSADRGS